MAESIIERNRYPENGHHDDILSILNYDSVYMVNLANKYIPCTVCSLIPAVIALLLCGQFEIARVIYQCTKFLSIWCLGSLFIDIAVSIITCIFTNPSPPTQSEAGNPNPTQVPSSSEELDQNQNEPEWITNPPDSTIMLNSVGTISTSRGIRNLKKETLVAKESQPIRLPRNRKLSQETTKLIDGYHTTTLNGKSTVNSTFVVQPYHSPSPLTEENSDTSIFGAYESADGNNTFGIQDAESELNLSMSQMHRNIRQRRSSRSKETTQK